MSNDNEEEAKNEKTREQTLQRLNDLLRQRNEYDKEHYKLLSETAALLGDKEEARANRSLEIQKEIGEEYRKTIKELKLGAKAQDDLLAKEGELLELLKQGKEFQSFFVGELAEGTEELQKLIEARKEELALAERTKTAQEKFGKEQRAVIGDMAKSIGISKDYSKSFLGNLTSVAKALKEGKDAGLSFAENFGKIINYQNISLSLFSKIYETSMKVFQEFDKAQASLAKATGQGREYNDVLYDTGRAGNLYGVSMQEAADSIKTLVAQTSAFSGLNKKLQADIAIDVAKMQELGISTENSAKIFQNFNQGLGITATESIKMQKELAMAGVEAGIGAEKITQDFNNSLGTLMVYGRESVNVFKGIAAAAKAAGVETSTLLGIASKFDTFAGAAEGAGKLNALLGTQLSTTEMLMATEDERIRMLVESVQAQGVAFQDMDRFTQKAIAQSVGITDMAEANRIFGMSLKEYDENEKKLKASADAQKKFEDAVAATVPVMDQFKRIGAELIVTLEPFFKGVAAGAEKITNFLKGLDSGTKEVAGSVLALAAGFGAILPLIKALGGGFKMFSSVFGFFKTNLLGTGEVIEEVGEGTGEALEKVSKGTSKSMKIIGPSFKKFAKRMGAGLKTLGRAAMQASSGFMAFGVSLATIILPIAATVAAVAALAAGMGVMYEGVAKIVSAITGPLSSTMSSYYESKTAMAEAEAKSAEALAKIVNGKPEKTLESIKAMVAEVNKIGEKVEVRSTLENLALITTGTATSITGEKIKSSAVNISNNISNVFDGLKFSIDIGGEEFKTAVLKVVDEGVTP